MSDVISREQVWAQIAILTVAKGLPAPIGVDAFLGTGNVQIRLATMADFEAWIGGLNAEPDEPFVHGLHVMHEAVAPDWHGRHVFLQFHAEAAEAAPR